LLFLFLFFASFLVSRLEAFSGQASYFEIKTAKGKIYTYPSTFEGKISLKSGNHRYLLEIKGGKLRILEANCPDRLCVKAGSIWLSGERLICLPGKLIIIARGKEDVDAINR
jgi:hypothetical protein